MYRISLDNTQLDAELGILQVNQDWKKCIDNAKERGLVVNVAKESDLNCHMKDVSGSGKKK